jgi:hypothetical protein
MLAAFGTGARLKFARGDAASAPRRIEDGMNIARSCDFLDLKRACCMKASVLPPVTRSHRRNLPCCNMFR